MTRNGLLITLWFVCSYVPYLFVSQSPILVYNLFIYIIIPSFDYSIDEFILMLTYFVHLFMLSNNYINLLIDTFSYRTMQL